MTSATLGLAIVLATLLLGRAATIRVRVQPVPWWLTDLMNENVVAPALVTSMTVGILILGTAVTVERWGVLGLQSLGGMAASVAVFLFLWRLLTAWSLRVGLTVAPAARVAPAAAQNDSDRPPVVPPLKKAA